MGKAKQIAGELNMPFAAVVMGGNGSAAEPLSYGAATVSPSPARCWLISVLALPAGLKQAIAASSNGCAGPAPPSAGASFRPSSPANSTLPRRTRLPVDGGKIVAVGSICSTTSSTDGLSAAMQVISVRPRYFPMPKPAPAGGSVQALDLAIGEDQVAEKVKEVALDRQRRDRPDAERRV